jgi:NAD(P)H-dependent FMN reductase
MNIIGISGSLRKGSYNTALLRAAATLVSPGTRLEVATIHGIPLYDGDAEAAGGVPPAVQELKDRVAASDGLILASPEYNNSLPGVFKNTIDWMSRPAAEIARVFADRPVAVMGATPGQGGTILAQSAWLPVLRTLRTRPWFGGRLIISGAGRAFNEAGELVDDKVREQLQAFVLGFEAFIAGK